MFLLSLISKIRFIEKNRIKVMVNGLYYCICFNLITTKLLIYPLIKNMIARVTELLNLLHSVYKETKYELKMISLKCCKMEGKHRTAFLSLRKSDIFTIIL